VDNGAAKVFHWKDPIGPDGDHGINVISNVQQGMYRECACWQASWSVEEQEKKQERYRATCTTVSCYDECVTCRARLQGISVMCSGKDFIGFSRRRFYTATTDDEQMLQVKKVWK
jgi:hypothetical protein